MGKTNIIRLGNGKSFSSKAACLKYFKDLLNANPRGTKVPDQHFSDLHSLFVRNPDYQEKVGSGVDHFIVDKSPDWPTNCFYVVRRDGTRTDFSYKASVDGQEIPFKARVSSAFRYTVYEELVELKALAIKERLLPNGKIICDATGQEIETHEAELDHQPPKTFQVLLDDYLKAHALTYAEIPLSSPKDNQSAYSITDLDLVEDFQRYHREAGSFRIIQAAYNRSQAAQHKIKKSTIEIPTSQMDFGL